MNILLIAGHGQGDPGAVGNGYKEAELVREIATSLKSKLSAYANVDLFDTSKNMYKYLKAGNTFNFKKYDYSIVTEKTESTKDLKDKYNNIDYLLALTKTLENDYKEVLKGNTITKTKVVCNGLFICISPLFHK